MSNVLNDIEIEELADLGQRITTSLSCDANGTGTPCRTDRFAAIEDMINYLLIHDYRIANSDGEWIL